MNLSTYWIIGAYSPLTYVILTKFENSEKLNSFLFHFRYNMVGNIKFSLIILAGFIIFRDPIKIEQLVAIILVMLGNLIF